MGFPGWRPEVRKPDIDNQNIIMIRKTMGFPGRRSDTDRSETVYRACLHNAELPEG